MIPTKSIVSLSALALLSGCVGSMPCKMTVLQDGDAVYEALITIIETDDTPAEIWRRAGRPRGVPLIPIQTPDPVEVAGKTSLVLEGAIQVTLERTPLGPLESRLLKTLELVRDDVDDDGWYLPPHEVRAIQEAHGAGK